MLLPTYTEAILSTDISRYLHINFRFYGMSTQQCDVRVRLFSAT